MNSTDFYNMASYNNNSDKNKLNNDLNAKNSEVLITSTWFPSAASSIEEKYNSRGVFPDGPMAANYEKYVHNIFRPGNKLPKLPANTGNSISAQSMVRIQDLLGSAALDDSYDEDLTKLPLEKMFSEQGLIGTEDYYKFHSYHRTKNHNDYRSYASHMPSPFENKDSYLSNRRNADAHWKRNNKQVIIDRKGSDTIPLTPYMYAEHPYVRRQDSRIVGSNFVQITSRPRDSFLDKIDKTLAEVRAMPRF
ncbi:unnamed protein product [Thelazia callipaeda]|uniref:ZM domain-containing protein n=1 Tax=Thelazia callipaeda TaxID=103827 RepID=A0A0N5CXA8_THECL|nr:unnamed protein product [Thelazia callipaeda]